LAFFSSKSLTELYAASDGPGAISSALLDTATHPILGSYLVEYLKHDKEHCMETHGMALVVRNTFLTYSKQEEDGEQLVRSSSAPPAAHRHAKGYKGDFDSTAVSTTCESLERDTSTVVTDSDDAVSLSSDKTDGEHEGASLPITPRHEIESENFQQNLATGSGETSPQDQLEQMSQMVMDIWAKLRVVESSIEAESPTAAAIPTAVADLQQPWNGAAAIPTAVEAEVKSQPAQISKPATPASAKRLGRWSEIDFECSPEVGFQCQKLASNARPFVPSGPPRQGELP